MIGEKAVHELADGIGIEKCRADQAEIGRREDAGIDQRLLDDRQCQAAGIDEAVADRDGDHHAQSMAPVECVDLRGVGERFAIRPGCEGAQQCVQGCETPPACV